LGVRALLALALMACSRDASPIARAATHVEEAALTDASTASVEALVEARVEVKTVEVPGDVPVFHLAGKTGKRIVFLHPMCSHGLGYLQAFQFAAHERASAIALQGEKSCGGAYRQWGFDFAVTDARIAAAWAAVGDTRPIEDVLLVGYSQGSSIATALSERFPERYTRVVLIGAPRVPVITKAKCAVMVSAENDAWWIMKQGSERAAKAGIPSTFITIPGVRHGQMGDAEDWMKRALAFCDF
jgi:hypothetical protein